MDLALTPVKIRGRKRNHAASLLVAKLQASQSSDIKRQKKMQKQRDKAAAMSMSVPTLQGLPQELLEMIFLYSMNMSLPRCSPDLGRTLSSSKMCIDFTMRALFDTVDHTTNHRDRIKTSDAKLQSHVLNSRFFTFPFFLKYVHHAHNAMIKLRGKAWEKTGIQVPGVHDLDGLWPFQFTKIPYLGFADGFFVPEKLLHGPWTTDKASLLYVLTSLHGQIDWAGSLSGEIAKSGIKEAISVGNEHAVAALAVLLGVPRAITTDMLRFAVVDCRCSINILRHLLFNAQILAGQTTKDTLNFHDPQLWAWAGAHDDRAIVKELLIKADAFNLEFYFEQNADWKSIVPFPYGGTKFDTRTAFSDIVRELLMNLYRNYGRKITTQRQRRAQENTHHIASD
ncbi:hypothetical protein ACEQ8H_007266 [Pleosporales sp. CAS-2024a]